MPVAKKRGVMKWITQDEAMRLLDARARRVLNISGDEFVKRWKAGQYRDMDSGDCPGVIELALLAPTSGTSRARKRKRRSGR